MYKQPEGTSAGYEGSYDIPCEINEKNKPITIIIKKNQMIMYKIQANASGTRSIEVSDKHLETLAKYSLLNALVDSNGIVDEPVLDKLKLNVRSLLESSGISDKDLLDLCLDVIYNNNMKALGLANLVALYKEWESKPKEETEE